MWQLLLNLATQLSRNQEDGAVVLHHEGHKFGGEELIQVHLISRTQDAVGEHLHHLDRHGTGLNPGQLNGVIYTTVCAQLYQRARADEVVERRQLRVLADPGHEAQ